MRCLADEGHALADAFLAVHTVHGFELVVFLLCRPADALAADALVADIRTDGSKLPVDVGVVARDYDEIAHVAPRFRHLSRFLPVADIKWLADFSGAVVGQRCVDHVFLVAEMPVGHLGEDL